MDESTCSTPECDAPVFIKKRGLCRPCYGHAWRAGEFGHARRNKPWHRITSDDRPSMLGACTYCGPDVRIVIRDDRAVCWKAERVSARKYRHGISQEDARALVDATGWACEICGDSLREQPYCIDHDHDCCPGKHSCGECVRGILCRRCNVGIGMLLDNERIVAAALHYLSTKNSLLRDSDSEAG